MTPVTERSPFSPYQKMWAQYGVVHIPRFIDEESMRRYEEEWLAHNGGVDYADGDVTTYERPGGWPHATPYMDHPRLRDLVCNGPLAEVLVELTGEYMGVHLNLTGWTSTRRDWHRDQYLNESYVGGFYAAVWIALDTIHPDSGPFEYVAGSHRGSPISQMKIRRALKELGAGPDWPTHSERILTPLFEQEMDEQRVIPQQFIAQRGDVLVWHGRLLHRGSVPKDPRLERRALIAHYSGIHHRPDMPPAVQHPDGGWFFPLQGQRRSPYHAK